VSRTDAASEHDVAISADPEPGPDADDGLAEAPRRRPVARYVVIPIAVVLALFVVLLATRDSATDKEGTSPLVGKAAPATTGTDYRGGAFDLDSQRGKWVVVNFFATWCTPCKVEHPELVAFSSRHATANDASVVSVAFDDSGRNVADFFTANGGTWPVLVENTGSIAIDYGVRKVPESYHVSPTGVVATKLIGGVTANGLDALIARFTGGAP